MSRRAGSTAIWGDHASAIQALDAGIRLDPTYAKAYWWRAASKATLGDAAGAQTDKAAALKLDPKVGEGEPAIEVAGT
ncbi:hypothetical protein [Phenylobacterium sp. J367]|uniref:hypothetical protein n=1 Tax=Phenylobacterium sp. J367 TaxID=2898435 RepID=UPI0021512D03|nr:hypothetical protein [Phenylobacterium sp. J367]MCR5880061.1 hypothetical protein [Phenylobacterium sp. J367]